MSNVRLVFDSGQPVAKTSGPWALFRLFAQGTLAQTDDADRYKLSFTVNERHASYEIRAGSVLNPFAPGVLRGFQCPSFQ